MPQNIPCTSAAVVNILFRSSNGVKVSKRLVDVFKVFSQSLDQIILPLSGGQIHVRGCDSASISDC